MDWWSGQSTIYYQSHASGSKFIWEVDINTDAEFVSELPNPFYLGGNYRNNSWGFDIHPNGEMLIMAVGDEEKLNNTLDLIVNWRELLKE